MRKVYIAIVSLLTVLVSCSQLPHGGSWDEDRAIFMNKKHGIVWELNDELEWAERPFLTRSGLFKVRNDRYRILCKLEATRYRGRPNDIWNMMSFYDSDSYKQYFANEARRNDMVLKSISIDKSELAGQHAVRVQTDMAYPTAGNPTHSADILYHICKNGYSYSIGVTALSLREEDLGTFEAYAEYTLNNFIFK